MARRPVRAKTCSTNTSTRATDAVQEGKNDGISVEKSKLQSASSAMGATGLSHSERILQPVLRAASYTRTISCEYGAKAINTITSPGRKDRSEERRVGKESRVR